MITQAFMRCKAKKKKKSRHFTMVLLDEIQWVQYFLIFEKFSVLRNIQTRISEKTRQKFVPLFSKKIVKAQLPSIF